MKSPKIFQKIKEKLGGKINAKLSKLSYRQFFFIIIAVCVAVFAMLMVVLPDDNDTRTTQKKQQQQDKPKVEIVKVVTANRDIPPRTILREDMLIVRDIPNDLLPDGYITDVKQAINLPAAVALQKGDVLTNKKFYADIRMAGFPGKIPDDCRAVSIAISDVTGVAGFAKPGDYVDIMAVEGKRGSRNGMVGKILLQNILLLGINKSAKVEQPNTTAPTASKDNKQQSQSDGKTEETASNSKDKDKKKEAAEPGSSASAQAMATATLAVTPAQALQLAVAAQTGTLSLALRPVVPKESVVLDTEYVVDTGTDTQEHGSDNYQEPAPAATPVTPAASVPLPPSNEVPAQVPAVSTPPKPETTVEIIRGTQSQSTTVRSE